MRDYSRLAQTAFARDRLAALTVLVIGAGALGNEVLKNLALLGIGHVLVVDRDVVEASNLTRSVLFCTTDIDDHLRARTPKAELAVRRIRELNADVRATAIVGEVADVGLGWFRRADVVFGCLDNELARLELGWACQRTDRLLVDGGLGWHNPSAGQVSLFPGDSGPCYACGKGPDRRRALMQELQGREDPCWMKERADPAVVATTPLAASAIAALQVERGLRGCLDSVDDRTVGQAFRLAMHPTPSLQTDTFERSPTCPLHAPESRIARPGVTIARASADVTIVELLELSGVPTGTLVLDWPMTVRARCTPCAHEWNPAVRRARFRREGRCPLCDGTLVVEVEVLTGVDRHSQWSGRTILALGLPTGHVHEVVGADGHARVHVEVVDDLPAVAGEGA